MAIFQAVEADIPHLVKLLDSAYRGETSKKGWTTEADLLKGEKRTDETAVNKLMQTSGAVFLKYTDEANEILGCVFLHKIVTRLYLGMLSVSPLIQAKGIGKELMVAAEKYAREQHCSSIFMKVISVRRELVEWYERRGYFKTGQTEPFPTDERFGIQTQPLEFQIMEKNL
jgi:GNAT superfamily N-acetyltransferase